MFTWTAYDPPSTVSPTGAPTYTTSASDDIEPPRWVRLASLNQSTPWATRARMPVTRPGAALIGMSTSSVSAVGAPVVVNMIRPALPPVSLEGGTEAGASGRYCDISRLAARRISARRTDSAIEPRPEVAWP